MAPPLIAQCLICTALQQRYDLDYERNSTRPRALDGLTVITTSRHVDTAECWQESTTLQCPQCDTFYSVLRRKDEGRSFGDRTEDTERVRRLSPYDALDVLSASPARSALVQRLPALVLALQAHLAELPISPAPAGRHIQRYAIQTVTHAMLVSARRSAIERDLLEHAAPVVRIECLQEILALATVPKADPATPGSFRACLREAACAFLVERSIGGVVTSVLSAPAAPSLDLSEGRDAPADTHERAANAVFTAAHNGYPIDDLTVDLVAALLHTTRERRFHAAWALSAIIHQTPARGLALGERLEKVGEPHESEGAVRALLRSVAALLNAKAR